MHVDEVDLETGMPIPLNFATCAEVARFETSGLEQYGPTREKFKIDLSAVKSRWNKQAAAVFSNEFIAADKYGVSNDDKNRIIQAFLTHIKVIQKKYRENDDEEEAANIKKRDAEVKCNRLMRRRNVSSLTDSSEISTDKPAQLLQRRQKACYIYKEDPSMKRLLPIFLKLTPDAMSGDEEVHEGGDLRYAITNARWRHPSIRTFFRIFDGLHLSTRISEDGRASSGAMPHIRIESNRPDIHERAPPKLPINFYDAEWLNSLQTHERARLDVQPPVNLMVTKEMAMYVMIFVHTVLHQTQGGYVRLSARYKRATARGTVPLPQTHPGLERLCFTGPFGAVVGE